MSGTLNNIYNDISFALYLHSKTMARLQEQASTGSRINKVSDSPAIAHQILNLSSRQKILENYINSLTEIISRQEIISAVIEDMSAAFTEAKKSLPQIINGIYNQEGRERIAEQINNILEQIVLLANTKYKNQYLFGGDNTTSPPYKVQRTDGEITKVTYQGSSQSRDIEVAPGIMSSAFYVGEILFRSNNRGEPIFIGNTGAKPGSGTSNVTGDVWLTVIHDGSNYKLSIDDGISFVTVPEGGDTNQAVINSQTGKILYVDSTAINNTGVELVRMPGTYDIFNVLITARDILRNEKELPDTQLRELQNGLLTSLDEASNLLAQNSVLIGAKMNFLDNLKNSLTKMKYNAEDEVAQLQDADIAQIAIDLSRHEVLYQMSLLMAGKLISISLLDFIK